MAASVSGLTEFREGVQSEAAGCSIPHQAMMSHALPYMVLDRTTSRSSGKS